MSFLDSIFGGESTKGIKFNKAENDRKREGIDQYAQQARGDVQNIIPQINDALNQGYSGAIDISRQAPQGQLAVLQNTAQRAQESILGGMNAYQNAILGTPTGLQENYYNNQLGMRPMAPGINTPGREMLNQTETPNFLSGVPAGQGSQQGAPQQGSQSNPMLSISAGQTTNAQILDQLYKNGQISDYDYSRMSESFNNGGSGDGTGWSYGLPASEMMGWLPEDIHPRFRETNNNIFNAINQFNPNAASQPAAQRPVSNSAAMNPMIGGMGGGRMV